MGVEAMVEASIQIRCERCEQAFATFAEHHEHAQRCADHYEAAAQRRCPACRKMFANHNNMRRHVRLRRCAVAPPEERTEPPQVMWRGRMTSILDVPLGRGFTQDLLAALTQRTSAGGALQISLTTP